MFHSSLVKTVLAILVSATMAIPGSLFLSSSAFAIEGSGDAKDGIPVVLQSVQTADGRTAYIAVAPVPQNQESQVVDSLAANDPRHFLLAVANPDDPALKTAFATGNLEWIKTFFVANPENSPILKVSRIARSVKEKIVARFNAVGEFAKREKTGLMMATYIAGITGGFVYYQSSSVAAGAGVFAGIFMWNAFQAACTEKWDRVLERSGQLAVQTAGLVGSQMSEAQKRIWSTGGSFLVSWTINSALISFIFSQAGHSNGLLNSIAYGYSVAYDINDKNVANGVARGSWGFRVFKNWIVARILLGSIFEIMSFVHVPYVQLGLTGLTTAGLLWLVLGRDTEGRVAKAARKSRFKILNPRVKCESRLDENSKPKDAA